MFRLPVVFMHYSNSDYLKYTLQQCKISNPESTIYLLGDSENNCYDFVEHHYFDDYSEEANIFAKIYKHYNTTPYHYALFDFQRWFILKEFLTHIKIDKCLYLDSDVMLYVNVTEEQKKFENYGFTISNGMCGCTFFLNKLETLNAFCQFLMDIYSKKDRYHFDKMVSHFVVRRKNKLKGGACDMTALQLFTEQRFGEVGEVSLIIDGSVYDPIINKSYPGLEMDGEIKKIIWKKDGPYGIHMSTRREIKFNSLHFQGGKAKNIIHKFSVVK